MKKILRVLLAAILLLAAVAFFFVRSLRPDYNGDRTLQGLQDSVTVYYDTYGIPHIFAGNEPDAFRALGYVHAQDRLWQMDLLRRVAPGRLSEVFGPDLLDTDKFFLSLGIDQSSRELLEGEDLSSPEFQVVRAYLDGVNAFIETGPTPPEYFLTGLEKKPFEVRDVYNAIGYMAFTFAMAHKTDPFLEDIRNKLPPEYLQELLEEPPGSTEMIPVHDSRDTTGSIGAVASALSAVLDPLPLSMLEGSNSWVIGPSKTKNGQVILANDPHIGFAQPSVWFEAHVRTPAYEKYGYHLAGIPFPMLGHDRQLAYGLTMFENDDIDFYAETTDPADSTRYKRPDGWKSFKTFSANIPVKDGDTVRFSYRTTDKGPVLNPVLKPLEAMDPVSMSWTYLQGENQVLKALYGIGRATDLASFEDAVRRIHAPGLNVMYGDAEGNVAWWAAARLHRIPDSLSTKVFQDGAGAGPEFTRTLPFDANPKSINPPGGYVYSANNQPDSTSAGYIPGYYLPENRARRITDLLDASDNWDREAVSGMITDGVSTVNTEVVRALSRHVEVELLTEKELPCMDAIHAWDGSYPLDGQEALIYHRWIYYLLEGAFRDELGPEGFKALLATHLHKRLIARMAERPESVWWDNTQTTDSVETMAAVVNAAFRKARASIGEDFGENSDNWRWGEVHQLEHKHPIGQVKLLRSFFNVGPFPAPATREVINNLAFQYDSTGLYPVTAGPSTRRIVDFSDVENSISILPTGQSGNPLSPHYDDQAEMYMRGEFRKMMLNPEEIRETAEHTLRFYPGE